jgi:hypothetical protein
MEPKVTDRVDAVSKAGASKQTREVKNEIWKYKNRSVLYALSFSIYHLAKRIHLERISKPSRRREQSKIFFLTMPRQEIVR